MIAVDANVVLRLILGDDQEQAAAIARMMAKASVFVSLTVLVEVGWVLESRYRLPRNHVADSMTGLLTLEGIEVARSSLINWAVDRYRSGADWADVIHVVAAAKLERFATLDRDLHRRAHAGAPVPVDFVR